MIIDFLQIYIYIMKLQITKFSLYQNISVQNDLVQHCEFPMLKSSSKIKFNDRKDHRKLYVNSDCN